MHLFPFVYSCSRHSTISQERGECSFRFCSTAVLTRDGIFRSPSVLSSYDRLNGEISNFRNTKANPEPYAFGWNSRNNLNSFDCICYHGSYECVVYVNSCYWEHFLWLHYFLQFILAAISTLYSIIEVILDHRYLKWWALSKLCGLFYSFIHKH